MEVRKIFVNADEVKETKPLEEVVEVGVESKVEEVVEKPEKKISEEVRRSYSDVERTGDLFLNRYFKSYSKKKSEGKAGVPEVSETLSMQEQEVAEALEDYKYLMEKEIAFDCTFDTRRSDYSYMTISDGVTIIMKKPGNKSVTKGEDYIIGRRLKVVVVDVDVENRIVLVENTSAKQVDATRLRLKEAIDKSLNRGQKVLVSGKVVGIYDKVVTVNIFEKRIEGICTIDYWRKGFVRSLAAECVLGENYDFYIVAQFTDNKRKRYVLDRRELVRDEWDVLAENKLLLDVLENKGSITLRCIEKPEGKTYWWGVSDTIKGIEIMCDYTRAAGKIEFGESYKCRVDKFNLEKRILRCTPYAKASGESSNNALGIARRIRAQQQEVRE